MFYQVLIIACVSVVGLSAIPTITKKDCPKSGDPRNFQVFQDKCYYFSLDYVKTFQDAEKFCKKFGGNLAMVKSKEVNSFLQSYITQFHVHNHWITWIESYWIGLKYQEELGGYYWVDGTPLKFHQLQNQTVGECVVMDAENGQWNEELCRNKKRFGDDDNDSPTINQNTKRSEDSDDNDDDDDDDDDDDKDSKSPTKFNGEDNRIGFICEFKPRS